MKTTVSSRAKVRPYLLTAATLLISPIAACQAPGAKAVTEDPLPVAAKADREPEPERWGQRPHRRHDRRSNSAQQQDSRGAALISHLAPASLHEHARDGRDELRDREIRGRSLQVIDHVGREHRPGRHT